MDSFQDFDSPLLCIFMYKVSYVIMVNITQKKIKKQNRLFTYYDNIKKERDMNVAVKKKQH